MYYWLLITRIASLVIVLTHVYFNVTFIIVSDLLVFQAKFSFDVFKTGSLSVHANQWSLDCLCVSAISNNRMATCFSIHKYSIVKIRQKNFVRNYVTCHTIIKCLKLWSVSSIHQWIYIFLLTNFVNYSWFFSRQSKFGEYPTIKWLLLLL